MKKIIKGIIPYVIIVIVVIFIRFFIATPVIVDGTSMDNTLKNNQILILNKLDHKYNRYDIVVFNYNGERLIKRIIGMPKDKIESKDNVLYINDIEVDENYISSPTNDFIEIVGDNEYLLLGDNRKNSFDSRYIGSINKNDIIGTISIRLFPFSKIGKIN